MRAGAKGAIGAMGAAVLVTLGGAHVSEPVAAQWLNYPTAGVPRAADGRVNMTAPAPRLTNGRPDLSGLWIGEPARRAGAAAGAADEPGNPTNLSSSRHMRDIGIDLPGGLPYQPWLIPIVKERTANEAIDDPHIRCLPDNFLRAYGLPHLLKFVQTPQLLVVLNEMNAGYRQVFTDGRPLPTDPNPAWQGYSSAQWSGRWEWPLPWVVQGARTTPARATLRRSTREQ